MTENEELKHLAARQSRAEQIVVEAHHFKICEQCRSIFQKHAPTCSVCGAYRFIDDPEAVRSTAKEMGSNPFPATSGTVPRI